MTQDSLASGSHIAVRPSTRSLSTAGPERLQSRDLSARSIGIVSRVSPTLGPLSHAASRQDARPDLPQNAGSLLGVRGILGRASCDAETGDALHGV